MTTGEPSRSANFLQAPTPPAFTTPPPETITGNLALASKNKPADNKKKQPPQADPNKVYNIPIGDSFSKGPDDAAITIIEWSDFQ